MIWTHDASRRLSSNLNIEENLYQAIGVRWSAIREDAKSARYLMGDSLIDISARDGDEASSKAESNGPHLSQLLWLSGSGSESLFGPHDQVCVMVCVRII